MRKLFEYSQKLSVVAGVLLVLNADCFGQFGPFQVKWSFDYKLSGTVNNSNFQPQDATLQGAIPFGLRPYAVTNAVVAAYVTKNWPAASSPSSYLEVKLVPLDDEFNLATLDVRLRRSANGPRSVNIKVIISKYGSEDDSISIDYGTISLTDSSFKEVSIPIALINQQSTFTFRIHGYSAVNTNGTLQFDELIISGERIGRVLPVHMTYFNAQAIDNQVELNWETAWEQNSREFVVQRSSNLKEFGNLGRVAAAGESDGQRRYAFTDFNPLPGNAYYRLKIIDNDDIYEYSKVRDVIVRSGQPTLWVAANPTSGERIRVRASGLEAAVLRLTTIMGQNVSFRINRNGDGYTELIPAVTLAPGLYFLSLDQNGLQKHTRVLVR